ncbi:hypothetical protein EV361DRAFT_1003093 [Lentinula raphanica]|nr:hypothetical protein EV361DRAFT_1003093 [Lentinula raphanica]
MTSSPNPGQWMLQITNILNNNGLTGWDFLHNLLRHGEVFEYTARHRQSIIENIDQLFSTLVQSSAVSVQKAAAKIAAEAYRGEILHLVDKEQGFHFGAKHATLEQLEAFAIENLAGQMETLCPLLSDLLIELLDARSVHRHRIQQTEVSDMELTGDDGTDAGSDNEETVTENETDREEEGNGLRMGIRTHSEWDMDVDVSVDNSADGYMEVEKQKRRTQARAIQDAQLLKIKRVLILSIIGNSTNQNFNSLQSFVGLFFESKQTPEIIIELAAHMGISVSTGSLQNMVKSLNKQARMCLKSLPKSNKIYDNVDVDFQKGQPTAENQKSHISFTAATFVPFKNIDRDQNLRFMRELYQTSPHNPHAAAVTRPVVEDIFPQGDAILAPDVSPASLYSYYTWLCQQVLVEHGGVEFACFRKNLGEPASIQVLPSTQKDIQYPAEAINADEGTYDGNAEVIVSLLKQSNTSDDELEQYVELFHGDLGTLERIEGLKRMRTIEQSAKNRLTTADPIIYLRYI